MVEKASGAAGRRGGLRSHHAGNGTVGIEKHPVGIGGRTDLRRSDLRAAQRKRRDHWLCGRCDSTGDSGRNRRQSGKRRSGTVPFSSSRSCRPFPCQTAFRASAHRHFPAVSTCRRSQFRQAHSLSATPLFPAAPIWKRQCWGTVWKHWGAACSPAVKVWQRCSFPPTCRKWAAAFPELHCVENGCHSGTGADAGRLHIFPGCSRLYQVKLPAKMTEIQSCAFEDCPKLETLTLPESLTTLGYGAFQNCSGLQNISLPGAGHRSRRLRLCPLHRTGAGGSFRETC